MSHLLRQELACYHDSVDQVARAQARDKLTLGDGRLGIRLPSCCAADITVRHPLNLSVVEPILGRRPIPAYPMRHQDFDDFLHILRAKLEREPEVLYASPKTVVFGISAWLVLKITNCPDWEVITNMSYVIGQVPEMPVPAVLGAFSGGGRLWIFLARAPGEPLDGVWKRLTPPQKLSVRAQLARPFAALAEHQRMPQIFSPGLGSVASGTCRDARRNSRASHGIILSEAQFNDFLCHAPDPATTRWVRNIRATMRDDHRIVFTHGDLHPRNIMVSVCSAWSKPGVKLPPGTVRVTAILGWEKAGWYPEHWEYVRAVSSLSGGPHDDALADWMDYLPTEAIGRHMPEYALDCLLRDCVE